MGITPELIQIYVDDQQIVTKALPPGTRVMNDELVIDEDQIENDLNVPADLRTAKIFQTISNSPFSEIKHCRYHQLYFEPSIFI